MLCYFCIFICMTKDEFIKRAEEVHKGEGLDYSQIIYKNNRTKVKIIDPEYGLFEQTPSNHLKGQKHPARRANSISESKRFKQKDVIEMFKNAHPNENLDYSQVIYTNMHSKVKIISHDIDENGVEYGEFWQEPCVHIRGCTHPLIGKKNQIIKQSSNTDYFIKKGKKIHNDKDYDYSQVNYINNHIKVKIICPKHGIFEISPDNFLAGKGCPRCGYNISHNENIITNYIINLVGKEEVIIKDRNILNGLELDIYLPN